MKVAVNSCCLTTLEVSDPDNTPQSGHIEKVWLGFTLLE